MKIMKKASLHKFIASARSHGHGGDGYHAGWRLNDAGAASKVTISVAYAANTTFDTTPLGTTWWVK